MMKRLIKAAFIALSVFSAVVAPDTASAHWRHGHWHRHGSWHPGPAATIGALTGFALGSAIAAGARPYPFLGPAPVYVGPAVGRTCVTDRWREWVPGWGWHVHRRTVCR
jgi:hypothetical protein